MIGSVKLPSMAKRGGTPLVCGPCFPPEQDVRSVGPMRNGDPFPRPNHRRRTGVDPCSLISGNMNCRHGRHTYVVLSSPQSACRMPQGWARQTTLRRPDQPQSYRFWRVLPTSSQERQLKMPRLAMKVDRELREAMMPRR